ncbi:MAD2 mitotic arrest deficient-like 2 [Blyttiomyces sp. JEL0837]|nr:MAD2 mitotic arrest deficient-like 2 [Blyttiomyces sp. JEL0837]
MSATFGEFADVLVEFLEVCIHAILAVRKVYPEEVFTNAKKYNLLVKKSRHPALNGYIADFLLGVKPDLEKGKVKKIHVSILDEGHNAVEKFVFQLRDVMEGLTFASKKNSITSASVQDIETFFRELIQKIQFSTTYLTDNPKDCSFRLFCELNEGDFPSTYLPTSAVPGVPWVMADASEVLVSQSLIVPLKSLNAGVVQVQMFVEEGIKSEGVLPSSSET